MSEESVTIKCNENGPFLVTGPASVVDVEGNHFDLKGKQKFALCRCTKSANQPFCDGSHNGCGFVMRNVAEQPTGAKDAAPSS